MFTRIGLYYTDNSVYETHFFSFRYNQLQCVPKSLSNCVNMDEFNVEGNNISQLPEGLLSSLTSLQNITLSRNKFTSYPAGGPSQFCSAYVGTLLSFKSVFLQSNYLACLDISFRVVVTHKRNINSVLYEPRRNLIHNGNSISNRL